MTQWRVGRVVDGTGLENRHTRKGIGGSNPSLSATQLIGRHTFRFTRPIYRSGILPKTGAS